MSDVSPSRRPDDDDAPQVASTADSVTAPQVGLRYGRLGIWALVCAPVAAILVVVLSRTFWPGASPAPPPVTVRVLVAGHDIPTSTAITTDNLDGLFQWADLPPGAVPSGAIGEPSRLVGTETIRTLKAGEPVAQGDLWAGLPDGYMLVIVRGKESDGFEYGFPRGTRVDVWLTPRGKVPPAPPEQVLSGGFVIPTSMIDRLSEGPGEPDRGVPVCLGLTPEQTKKLAAAEVRGTLRIVRTK